MWVRTLSGAASVERRLGAGKHGYNAERLGGEDGVEEVGQEKKGS